MEIRDTLFICLVILQSTLFINMNGLRRDLKYYETLHSIHLQLSHHPYSKINELEFYSHGRHFRLILTPRTEMLHTNFKAYEVNANGKKKTVHSSGNVYHGQVFGEIESHVQIHINDGVVTGSITIPNETFYIEPSWRQFPHLDNKTMIVYKSSDIILSERHNQGAEGNE